MIWGKEHTVLNRSQAVLLGLMAVVMVRGGLSAAASTILTSSAQSASVSGSQASESSDPRLTFDVLDASRKIRYESGGRNIFRMEARTAVKKHQPDLEQTFRPRNPDPAPAATEAQTIPINYYGYANKPGESRKVFLQQREDGLIFIVAEGDIVARRYRIVQVAPASIMMEDVLTGSREPIALTLR